MIGQIRRHLIIGSLISAFGLTGCVSQGKYDDLQARYEQLQAQNQQLEYQIARLRGAIKYTVNSDLLFPSGGWEMSAQGKQVIAKMASKLAPTTV